MFFKESLLNTWWKELWLLFLCFDFFYLSYDLWKNSVLSISMSSLSTDYWFEDKSLFFFLVLLFSFLSWMFLLPTKIYGSLINYLYCLILTFSSVTWCLLSSSTCKYLLLGETIALRFLNLSKYVSSVYMFLLNILIDCIIGVRRSS